MKDKKKPSPMADKDKSAKLEVLKHLHRMMTSAMGNSLKASKDADLEESLPMKKVTIASDSQEGLEEGLEKAEDLVGGELEDSNLEIPEDDEMLAAADSEEDEDEIQRQIEALHAKKAALTAKKSSSAY